MPRTPRISPVSGVTSQASLVLALAGAGVAVFLFLLFGRSGDTRAAMHHEALPASAGPEVDPAAPVEEELVQAATLEPFDPKKSSDKPVEGGAAVAGAATAALAAAAFDEEEENEAPKLRYLPGGSSEKIDPQKKLAKERRESRKRAAEAAARGEAPPEPRQELNPSAEIDRGRLKNRSGGVKRPDRGKGKKKNP